MRERERDIRDYFTELKVEATCPREALVSLRDLRFSDSKGFEIFKKVVVYIQLTILS